MRLLKRKEHFTELLPLPPLLVLVLSFHSCRCCSCSKTMCYLRATGSQTAEHHLIPWLKGVKFDGKSAYNLVSEYLEKGASHRPAAATAATWLCDACETAKCHLITFPIRSKGARIKGPDNPTSQLLPIIRNKSCSGTGKEGKTKEVVEDREVKKVVCEELCDKVVCDTIMRVKDCVQWRADKWCKCFHRSMGWQTTIGRSAWPRSTHTHAQRPKLNDASASLHVGLKLCGYCSKIGEHHITHQANNQQHAVEE